MSRPGPPQEPGRRICG
uniref:Nudix hydrolase 7 n=1 Tax=Bos taurus TaxID=9913 RepID=A0AAA9SML3_BOVIN